MCGSVLYTISAEDCFGIITKEIEALWQGHELVNKNATEPKGRIFVSKAVILLCECRKNRDADHLQNFIYDRRDSISQRSSFYGRPWNDPEGAYRNRKYASEGVSKTKKNK